MSQPASTTGRVHLSPPQTPLHLPQEAFLGQVAMTDAAAQLGAFLAQMPPVQDHDRGWYR